jgi:hypothetical protein
MVTMKLRLLFVAILALSIPAVGQVINCPSGFSTSGACGVSLSSGAQPFWTMGTLGNLPAVNIIPSGTTHAGQVINSQTNTINVQAFTATFTFIPNGQNISFVLQNNNNNPGYDLGTFRGGAGCEGGFFQAFTTPQINNLFALMLDSYGANTAGGETFTYSNTQIYQIGQSPCNPNDSGPGYWGTNKISTSPVPLNSPATTQGTTTGDTYSATVNYDGSNVNLCLIDVTLANGTCNATGTGGTGTYFQNTWSNISIPTMVDSTTAYLGIVGGVGETSTAPLLLESLVYTVNTPTATPSFAAWNANSTTNTGTVSSASPVYSLAPGSYSGTQSVSMTCSTASSNMCYSLVAGSTPPTILPQVNNQGGCQSGTAYTGAISVSSTSTLYAMCGTNLTNNYSAVAAGTYTISGTTPASAPTFSPAAGTYTGTQTVTASTSTSGCGSYIYFDTNTTPTTNQTTLSVPSSETIYAYVHGCPGYSDSSISSAAYTINTASSPSGMSGNIGSNASSQ